MVPVIVAIQNGPSAPINLIGKWLTEAGLEVRTIHAYAGQPLPNSIAELERYVGESPVAALIPLGGSMGALDDADAPWLPVERNLIRDAIAHDMPILGICLGAQLLAVSLDGEIGRATEPEIGIHPISIERSEDPIFASLSESTPKTIQWHQDVVSRLPSGATSLATSTQCANQVFKVGDIHYGLQFHPEADPTIVRMWEKRGDDAYQRSSKRNGIVEEVVAEMLQLEITWKPVIQRWATLIFAHLETRPRRQAQLP